MNLAQEQGKELRKIQEERKRRVAEQKIELAAKFDAESQFSTQEEVASMMETHQKELESLQSQMMDEQM